MKLKNKTIFVGVSGGVDSAVAAAMLLEQGFNVVGVFIRTWSPDFIECTWRNERRDAMRVCAHLGIPFLECDAEDEYKNGVADYMIEEYRKGNTPNPDVMCNREVKFGAFWNFAKNHGADFVATGHYAVSSYKSQTKNYELKKGIDPAKDQVYFLWTLKQEDLSHIIFPVGHLKKNEIRKMAQKYKLPNAVKKDSQGVCFLGPLDMKDFLSHYIKPQEGNVLNEEGEIIGSHNGATFFTLGERHGFNIDKKFDNNKPFYIVGKNAKENTIVVSNSQLPRRADNITGFKIVVINTNWISELPELDKKYTAQIRYHGEFLECKIQILNKERADVIFDKNILVDKGQSVVFYDKDACLGGAIVE